MIKILETIEEIKKLLERLKAVKRVENYKVYNRIYSAIDIHAVTDDNAVTEKWLISQIKEGDLYNINCYLYTKDEYENDEYVNNIFTGSEVEDGARYRLSPYFEKKGENDTRKKESVPVITFYSYKGGMGRTTTMISYAINLAMQNKRVFILDCDLEAPGYLNFFDLSNQKDLKNGEINGFVEYVNDTQFRKDPDSIDISRYTIDVGQYLSTKYSYKLHNIWLMPAGNLNENEDDSITKNRNYHRMGYLEGLSRLNLTNTRVVQQTFNQLFEKINKDIEPDVILIDSRTGFNDIIGTAITYFSNTIVGFFGSNKQTVPGLLQLLDSYKRYDFKLVLVNSILPVGDSGLQNHESFKYMVNSYFNEITNYRENKDFPEIYPLSRAKNLESLGISSYSDDNYIEYVINKKNDDYESIFTSSYLSFNPIQATVETEESISKGCENFDNVKTITLRNRILQNLKKTFTNITAFAESTDISEKTFFYRYCMYDLFDEKKFLIVGYKGTGKTYLYRALADSNEKEECKKIAAGIVKRVNIIRKNRGNLPVTDKLHFINILSINDTGNGFIDFNSIDIDAKKDRYFTFFWQIYTWNSIMLDEKFMELRQFSRLKEYILPINGNNAIARFEDLINKGINVLIAIEEDLARVNEYLNKNDEKLFVLYDQLDTRILPEYWSKVISPLIRYWRDYYKAYNSILPKIFIRTDIFKYHIEGTNTARLEENVINIEWSIQEIFAYLIKLIFSEEESKDLYYEIMKRVYRNAPGKGTKWIKQRKLFDQNENQLPVSSKLDGAEINGYINVFFGENVVSNKGNRLGSPQTYFKNNLSNADRKSISLRPFINTLDKNAIETALKQIIPYGHVQELISSYIYASRDVRIKAANEYFMDLAKDDYKDLQRFHSYLMSDNGKPYRLKTLTEKTFNMLIDEIIKSYQGKFETIKISDDLKDMLYATGIMAEKPTTGGKLYQFAPIYFYAWGLKNSKYDKDRDEDFD